MGSMEGRASVEAGANMPSRYEASAHAERWGAANYSTRAAAWHARLRAGMGHSCVMAWHAPSRSGRQRACSLLPGPAWTPPPRRQSLQLISPTTRVEAGAGRCRHLPFAWARQPCMHALSRAGSDGACILLVLLEPNAHRAAGSCDQHSHKGFVRSFGLGDGVVGLQLQPTRGLIKVERYVHTL